MRSERGTNSRDSSSWKRMTALVPGVSTMEIAQIVAREAFFDDAARPLAQRRLGAVLEDSHALGRGQRALGGDLVADERVYERGLPGVELAHHHEHEGVPHVRERLAQQVDVAGRCAEAGEEFDQALQQSPL